MKFSKLSYGIGATVLAAFVYLLYQSHTGTEPHTAGDIYMQAPPANQKARILQGSFSAERRSAVHEQSFQPMVIPRVRNASFDYKAAMEKLNEAKVSQDDPRLIQLIRDYYIEPPSVEAYHLDSPDRLEFSNGQTPFIDSRLNYMEGGFYVECGALNGEKGSNTLFFEKVRKWNGLLVEADPSNYQALKSKHRKAFTVNACLSPQPYPAMVTFNKAFNRGRVVDNNEAKDWIHQQGISKDEVSVQCFPLYSLLLALNQLTVDFFSLDVEGDELRVLKTIPFDKVDIKMMTVEYVHQVGKDGDLKSFVEKKGYDNMLQMSRWDGGVNDVIFRKKGLQH
ncbi:uncharacterized protein LOC127867739 isoform X2 [Dreissena polymorpha]|uniref:Methyltransferase FkbM domain-containing protein n=2 Tax=Dreissena polymorpha TaxID=45954 RepID=A0A9D4NDY9_DREPO|nr:uncharacterized protein LOC127867739 isoform X2 [Dreissena polymorpha]XP_052265076.1 uncharacterized protein LOC127867739 isoform X2 [Dreissena polymorpha]KAH3894693.1 hypothetical protein DPMN_018850 [Dreissena polymorpha]